MAERFSVPTEYKKNMFVESTSRRYESVMFNHYSQNPTQTSYHLEANPQDKSRFELT